MPNFYGNLINSIGAFFEKGTTGFKFGSNKHKITVKGNLEIGEMASNATIRFQDRQGVVAYLDDVEGAASDYFTELTGRAYAVWTGNEFEYFVVYPDYYIEGVLVPAGVGVVELNPGNDTFSRLDVIALDVNGPIVVPGDPALDPVKPTIDPITQIEVTTILVTVNATQPEETSINVYLENTEWAVTSNNGTVNADNTSGSFSGSKNVTIGAFTNLQHIRFTNVSPVSVLNLSVLNFRINLLATLANTTNIGVRLYLGANPVSNEVVLGSTHNFSKSTINSYQNVFVSFANFVLSGDTFDRVEFVLRGSNASGFKLDNIVLFTGVAINNGPEPRFFSSIQTPNGTAIALNAGDALTLVGVGLDITATGQSGRTITFTANGLIPSGGTTGQVLKKASDDPYDYSWQDESAGGSGWSTSGETNLSDGVVINLDTILNFIVPDNSAFFIKNEFDPNSRFSYEAKSYGSIITTQFFNPLQTEGVAEEVYFEIKGSAVDRRIYGFVAGANGSSSGFSLYNEDVGLNGFIIYSTSANGSAYSNFSINDGVITINSTDNVDILNSIYINQNQLDIALSREGYSSGIALNSSESFSSFFSKSNLFTGLSLMIELDLFDGVKMEASDSGAPWLTSLTLNTEGGVIVESTSFEFAGIQYLYDHSENFTDHSLVDKAYVDAVAAGITIQNSAASLPKRPNLNFTNGLQAIDDEVDTINVKLGGELTEDVTFTGLGMTFNFSDGVGFLAGFNVYADSISLNLGEFGAFVVQHPFNDGTDIGGGIGALNYGAILQSGLNTLTVANSLGLHYTGDRLEFLVGNDSFDVILITIEDGTPSTFVIDAASNFLNFEGIKYGANVDPANFASGSLINYGFSESRYFKSTLTENATIAGDFDIRVSGAGSMVVGGASVNASAKFQIDSTTKGFLPPRMTTTQRGNIGSPAAGLVIYNTSTNKLNFYDGTTWQELAIV
jgi:hypothetical protein